MKKKYSNYSGFPPTTALMEVQVPMTRTAECKQAYSKQTAVIDDRVLCAGYPEGGKDSCRVIGSFGFK